MSTPSQTDATQTDNKQSEKQLTPEELAAQAEQRRRETQAAYTKGQQKIKALEAEKQQLLAKVEELAKPQLTPEQREELDMLKLEDPDAWRAKLNKIEAQAKAEFKESISNLTGEAKKKAEQEFELERRQQALEQFNDSAKVKITDDVIANDVPPRITRKLEAGEVSFEEFLNEVQDYLLKGKVVANEENLEQPNLNEAAGGITPKDEKPEKSLSELYKVSTF